MYFRAPTILFTVYINFRNISIIQHAAPFLVITKTGITDLKKKKTYFHAITSNPEDNEKRSSKMSQIIIRVRQIDFPVEITGLNKY